MSNSNMNMDTLFAAGYSPPPRSGANIGIAQKYKVDYVHPDGGNWSDFIHNIVPNAALNAMLDILYGATAKWGTTYVGLVLYNAGNVYAATDMMNSHPGWVETVVYSDPARPTASWGSASGQSIANSPAASFTINGTAEVGGCFLTTSSTKSGTTGTLIGVGAFTGGKRDVANGGTLTVTVTATAATA